MHYALLMHVLDGVGDLTEVLPDDALLEPYLALLRLAQLPLEVTCCCPLEHNDEVGLGQKGIHVPSIYLWAMEG